jgi:serine/threonine protein kinase/tetratricopeptide (TPR) repeat protein
MDAYDIVGQQEEPRTMKCPECNAENPTGSHFCSICGVKLGKPAESHSSETEAMRITKAGVETGEILAGKYRVLETLGRGGMGVIYRAEDLKLRRPVVLKLLPPDLTRDPEARQRFIHEARAASALDHANICTIYDIDETPDGLIFIAMAYYPGQDLKERIKGGPMRVKEALNITIQIARGLARAHEAGIVHRDIKPANIVVSDRGEARILDFGLAKLAGQAAFTKVGIAMGTIGYMSPEQAQGRDIDHRTDIWSLGVVLYEMLAGTPPFRGEQDQAVIFSILNSEPVPLSQSRSDTPAALENIMRKALQKDPGRRYRDMDQMLKDLTGLRTKIQSAASTEAVEIAGASGPIPAVEQKPIAVISFENQTGEDSYDYLQKAIPNLLITSLEQSKYLRVVTWERMYDLLKQVGRDDVDVIDNRLGFELCRMEGVESVVVGSFVKAGEMFATDAKVLDVQSKRLLKSASAKGEGVDSILKTQIDELSREIAVGLGISDSTRARGLPIADVATSSMEAYDWFLKGRELYEKLYNDDAVHALKKAVERDPDFAVPHLYLALTYNRLREPRNEHEAYERAKALSGRASRKDRLYIEAAYARAIEQDEARRYRILKQIAEEYPDEKRVHHLLASHFRGRGHLYQAVEEYKRVLDLDPNYGWAMNELAYMYADVGDFDKAAELFSRYAEVSPGEANPIDSMGELYFRMGKLDQAIGKYKQALELKPDFYYADWEIGYVHAFKQDYDEALRWNEEFIENAPAAGTKASGLVWKCFYLYWLGRFKEAISLSQKAAEVAEEAGSKLMKVEADRMRGWILFAKGDLELSRRCFEQCREAVLAKPAEYVPVATSYSIGLVEQTSRLTAAYSFAIGLLDLAAGRLDAARAELERVKDVLPQYYSMLHAELLLTEPAADKAITVCEKCPHGKIPYMSDRDAMLAYNLPPLKDILARAFLRKGEIERAIAEYERLTKFDPDTGDRYLIHPLCYYRLAGLYEQQGRSADAVAAYERFLDLWKHADPGCPEVDDARNRLADLKT